MKKAHQDAIEEALSEIETYLVRVDDRHRHQLRLLLRRLVRQCLNSQRDYLEQLEAYKTFQGK